MKKLSGGSRKETFLILGAFAVVSVLFYSFVFNSSAPATQAPKKSKENSLGGTAEGSAAYNQTFQERMRREMQESAKETRRTLSEEMAENQKLQMQLLTSALEKFQEEAPARAQAPAQQVSAGVEKIQIGGAGAGSASGESTIFSETPNDIKPLTSAPAGQAPQSAETKKAKALAVPPNGFIKARTLNGIVAVNNAPPSSFLAKLSGRYQAANGFVIMLDGCQAHIEGRANLAAGRINGKPVSLTCNFEDGTTKTWQVSGYVVDSDGIEGIRGVITDNSGKKLVGATLGGGIALAGSALSRQQSTSYSGAGGTTQAFTGSVSQDIAGGLAQGAGNELSRQVGEVYSNYQASVQAGGGAEITIVLLNELPVPEEGKAITSNRSAGNGG